ncbi:DUF6415 family natural product biosynthesis protein [Streptomyces massasporeus]|uniref:DUF6415 family natural product biosynthesis protein n=1 Tax=Streptomyces massasporeus TaxID=67324 RepID=UPI00380F4572
MEPAALARPLDSVPRICALYCEGEARLRLSADPGRTLPARLAQARRLARSVRTLCDHYENEGHQCPQGPERAAYLRLLDCAGCRDCRAADDSGEAVGGCATGGRLYEGHRLAGRGPVAPAGPQ